MSKNILFITLVKIENILERGIYTDLIREFLNNGHTITVLSPFERRENKKTSYIKTERLNYLNVKTFNIQKTNLLEKGIGTFAVEFQFLSAIKKYTKDQKFDLLIYSTPPITFYKVIEFLKKRDNCKTYLLLKDIFPQNAVDMGLIKYNSPLYNYFRKKEKKLYDISDNIGCMSIANEKYILLNNKELSEQKIEVNPNSIAYKDFFSDNEKKRNLRKQLELPEEKTIFFYGGNLGKPQAVDVICEILKSNENEENIYFLIVGSGTEAFKIKNCISENCLKNSLYLDAVPKAKFDLIVESCDVGLLFLDKKFTIPNFPSRLLSYLENYMPVIAATDDVSDVGDILEKYNAGKKLRIGDLEQFNSTLKIYANNKDLIKEQGDNGNYLLKDLFLASDSYHRIISKL